MPPIVSSRFAENVAVVLRFVAFFDGSNWSTTDNPTFEVGRVRRVSKEAKGRDTIADFGLSDSHGSGNGKGRGTWSVPWFRRPNSSETGLKNVVKILGTFFPPGGQRQPKAAVTAAFTLYQEAIA